jgi:hypothetical protein
VLRRASLIVLSLLLVLPASAAAHGGTGMPSATDARVTVQAITPAVVGLEASVLANDFQLRLRVPAGEDVTVNRTAGGRPLHARGGTLTWREHRLRHPAPDGTLQIGFTLAGAPVLVDLVSRRGTAPSPWLPLLAGVLALAVGILRPRLAPLLAVGAFVVMLVGAAGGLLEGRGTAAAVAASVTVILLAALSTLALAAVPERFRILAAGAVAATALLLAMAQLPMLYRAFPVSALPDAIAQTVEALALALALGALAAVGAARPWHVFEEPAVGITPVG